MKQNVEAWEAVSSDIQKALKLHYADPSQSDTRLKRVRSPNIALQSDLALNFPNPSTMIRTKLQNSGTEVPPPLLAAALATKLHAAVAASNSDQTVPVRAASTVASDRLEGGVVSTAASETAPAAAGGRVDLAGQAVLQRIEEEAAGVEQREQEDTLRLSQDSLSSLALLSTESAVQARLASLQRSLATTIVTEEAPLLRALHANSATADLLLHRAPAGGTEGGLVGGPATAAEPAARRPETTRQGEAAGQAPVQEAGAQQAAGDARAPGRVRRETAGQPRAHSGAARQGRLVSLDQMQLAAMRHEVASMEHLASAAAAKSEAAAGQEQGKGVLEAAYRAGCRAYMLHTNC
jgi:hypothetical protein